MSSARVWAVATVASACLLANPVVAAADPLPAGCTQPDAAGPVTCVYTSGTNELLLPEGVTSVTVTAIGGRGGNFTYPNNDKVSGAGGRGAEVTGTVAVPSGTRTLYATVGGNGTSTVRGDDPTGGAGGANGGGTGGTPSAAGGEPGAGGGGASDIRTAPGDLESRLVVAAGGGGGSYGWTGGDAGAPGRFHLREGGSPAQAGTGTAGGAGGSTIPDGWSGSDGSLGVGGAGGPRTSVPNSFTSLSGGGGGAGLYGGGGGSNIGSGAGGSSLTPAGTALSLSDAAPSVTITYQPLTVTPPQPPTCSGSACLPTGMFGSS
ncbi:glycine-rich protein [Rhodococcoides fascians]|uniref:glycine-rich protein n=1 Tax=Rhodococcoides fascians TaxID=1828 RepID=UPI001E3A3B99|nr:glycine-rich protein [Rhodococcus fascians]